MRLECSDDTRFQLLTFIATESEKMAACINKKRNMDAGLVLVMWGQAVTYSLFGEDGLKQLREIIFDMKATKLPIAKPIDALPSEVVEDALANATTAIYQVIIRKAPEAALEDWLDEHMGPTVAIARAFQQYTGQPAAFNNVIDTLTALPECPEEFYRKFSAAMLHLGPHPTKKVLTLTDAELSNSRLLNLRPDETIN